MVCAVVKSKWNKKSSSIIILTTKLNIGSKNNVNNDKKIADKNDKKDRFCKPKNMNSLSSVQVVVAFAVIYLFFYLVVCSRYTYLPLEMFLFEFSVIIFNMLVQQTMITGSHSLSLSVYRFVEHLHLRLAVDFVLRILNSLSFISSVNSLCSFFSRSSY